STRGSNTHYYRGLRQYTHTILKSSPASNMRMTLLTSLTLLALLVVRGQARMVKIIYPHFRVAPQNEPNYPPNRVAMQNDPNYSYDLNYDYELTGGSSQRAPRRMAAEEPLSHFSDDHNYDYTYGDHNYDYDTQDGRDSDGGNNIHPPPPPRPVMTTTLDDYNDSVYALPAPEDGHPEEEDKVVEDEVLEDKVEDEVVEDKVEDEVEEDEVEEDEVVEDKEVEDKVEDD
ncbi:hypothetical protein Hamer_G025933, partial [Homarus americanus]